MIISLINRKGGVGKTTMVTTIAAALATLGYRVAVVDTDSQGHVALTFGIERYDGLFDAMVRSVPLEKVLALVDADAYAAETLPTKGELFVLPASDKTYRIATELGPTSVFALLNLLTQMRSEFMLDVILIDTSPTIRDFDAHIYLATDAFLHVTEAESLSMDGLDKAVQQMQANAAARQQHLKLQTTFLGVIINKIRPTVVHSVGIEDIKERYDRYMLPPIALRTAWSEASMLRQVIFRYAPESSAANEAWTLVKHILERIKSWQSVTA